MALSQQAQNNHYLLDEFKIYKDIDLTDSSLDNTISYILYSVEKFINDSFGIFLQKETVNQKTFSVNNGLVVLPSFSVELLSAQVDGVDTPISSFYIVGNILKGKDITLSDGIDNVTLTYNIGYDFDYIPFNIKLGMFIIVDRLYEKIENNANLSSSFTDPVGGKMIVAKELPKEAYNLLSPYMVVHV